MPQTMTVSKIIEAVKNEPDKKKKEKILLGLKSFALNTYLQLNFNPNIKFNLPDGITPLPEKYQNREGITETIDNFAKTMPAFCNHSPTVKKMNLQRGWMNILSKIPKDERILLENIKDKKVDIGLTQNEMHKIFPALIPDGDETDQFRKSDEHDKKDIKPLVIETDENHPEVDFDKENEVKEGDITLADIVETIDIEKDKVEVTKPKPAPKRKYTKRKGKK